MGKPLSLKSDMAGKHKFFQRLLFFLLLVLLPVQTSKHFWPPTALVNGIRVDYLSPALYVNDLLILLLVGSLFLSRPKLKVGLGWTIIMGLLLLPLFWVNQPELHLYGLIRILEFFGLFWLAKSQILSDREKWFAISLMLTWTLVLALSQFWLQGSIGGGTSLLGERSFSKSTPGIAQVEIVGRLWLRPYATLPHPNALAGFLLVGWWWWFHLYSQAKRKIERLVWTVVFFSLSPLCFIVVFLTWSRTAWIVALLGIGFWFLGAGSKSSWWRPLLVLSAILGLVYPWGLNLIPSGDLGATLQESVRVRQQLFSVARQLFNLRPFWGVGWLGFIPQLSQFHLALNHSWLQPVHSLFWLILVEGGLVGFSLLAILLWRTCQRLIRFGEGRLWLALFSVLLLGINDHYWLTLHQNQLLLVLLLAEIWRDRVMVQNKRKDKVVQSPYDYRWLAFHSLLRWWRQGKSRRSRPRPCGLR